jgi:hypothetical protein
MIINCVYVVYIFIKQMISFPAPLSPWPTVPGVLIVNTIV